MSNTETDTPHIARRTAAFPFLALSSILLANVMVLYRIGRWIVGGDTDGIY